MRVRYTGPALREFDAAVEYMLDHAPLVTKAFADSIEQAATQLRDHPYSAQETEMPGIRREYVRRFRYSIFYSVEGDEIVILHIRHAARSRPWE
jgi:plasmid stabilization system protein ParE